MSEREPAPILERILDAKSLEIRRKSIERPLDTFKEEVEPRRLGAFAEALANPQEIALIAEHKRHSPSKGDIRPGSSVRDVVTAYEAGGASALSVLTDEEFFKGSLDDLSETRSASRLPVLRKDFIIDEYQLFEAAERKADAILLIAAALDDDLLKQLNRQAQELGLDRLVEVHNREELDLALQIQPELIGINNRNLFTFETDTQTTFDLIDRIPAGITIVSESGIDDAETVQELRAAGVDAMLIGESLMRAADPEAKVRKLLGS